MTFKAQRHRMVDEQLKRRGLTDARVLAAFRKVPRHLFVPPDVREHAYADQPLPIGERQTISQPYIVALMLSHLRLHGHERVLEIGTGSGYQTALLAELCLELFSIERLPSLLDHVQDRLAQLGYLNVHLRAGNGSLGWPEQAPYDGIVVSAAAPDVPEPLLAQLGDGGRMVLPLGSKTAQRLVEVEKRYGEIVRTDGASCLFVPLIGEHGWPDEDV